MTLRRVSLTVFILLFALCVAYAAWCYPQLPAKGACHFGPSGKPDAWSTKTFFVTGYLAVTAINALLFLGISVMMPGIPVSLINLPNKSYWLAEERKRSTFDIIFRYLLWFASATMLLLLDMFHQSVQVNMGRAESLPHPLISLGLYLGFTALWCIGLLFKFGKKMKT